MRPQAKIIKPVGKYRGATTSEGQTDSYQYVINVRQRRLQDACSLFADARTSVPSGRMCYWCGVGARPAQGAATTTDKGLVRTLERAYIHLDMILCCTLAARTIDRLSDLNVYT